MYILKPSFLFACCIIIVSCASMKEAKEESNMDGVIKNEIIVKLTKSDLSPSLVTDKLKDNGLSHTKVLSKSMGTHLFSYSIDQTKPAKMITLIRKQASVASAEFNRTLKKRSR